MLEGYPMGMRRIAVALRGKRFMDMDPYAGMPSHKRGVKFASPELVILPDECRNAWSLQDSNWWSAQLSSSSSNPKGAI